MESFFQILKFEYGSSRLFKIFSFILKRKKDDRAVIPLSNSKHNSACYHRENYFDRTYVTKPKHEHNGMFHWHDGGTLKVELTRLQNFSWITLQDQIIKMNRAKNIFSTGRSAKLDYEVLINNISDNKYKNNAT